MAMVQLTETGDPTSRSIRAIVPNASLASFAVSEACSYWIAHAQSASALVLRDLCILAGASIEFDWARRPARLTSQGDMCYGASAISGLNLHIPSSKS
jgi:hypothetical protein